MLYHVSFQMDRQAIAALGAKALDVRAAENERAAVARDAGRLLGLWQRADATGVIFILDVGSHDELNQELRTLPMFPFVQSIEVTPLLAYPEFTEFSEPRRTV